MRMVSFAERVYDVTKKIPRGNVSTYGELARALGTQAYRAVGNALHVNPYAPRVPCHRVVCSDGRLGGFADGVRKKQRLLENEGVAVVCGRVDLRLYSFTFKKERGNSPRSYKMLII